MKSKIGLIDRLFLIFCKPKSVSKINNKISVIALDDGKSLCALKFKYAGNTQYHKLSLAEVEAIVKELSELRGCGSYGLPQTPDKEEKH